MFETFADLVKYEPGVYVENNVTRLGLNGFNIRGIGGNRVMTQVDGVQTSEQFDFGPFNIHQVAFDVDALKSVEIVRSANSALYGSDALGGVVSLFTKDPADYLQGDRFHVGAKTTWDGRANDASANLTLAGGTDRLQASAFVSANRGGEIRNQGTVATADDTRTVPNPQDVLGTQMLAKLVFTATPGNVWRVAAETYDSRVETEWYSDRGMADFGFLRFATVDADAVDTQDRRRYSLDHTLVGRGLDQVSWRGVRPVQRHVAGRRPAADGLLVRSAHPVPPPRHDRSRTGRLRRFRAGPALAGRTRQRRAAHLRRQLPGRWVRHAARPVRGQHAYRGAHTDQPALPGQVLSRKRRRRDRVLLPGGSPARPGHAGARRALRPLFDGCEPGRPRVHRHAETGSGPTSRTARCRPRWAPPCGSRTS